MRSSGSTPNPRPERPLRLLLLLAREDHPKACTGRRLVQRGLVQPVGPRPLSPPPVVLDPYASLPLSRSDVATAESGGVLAVDCSWNRLGTRSAFPAAIPGGALHGPHRRLPLLVAANPQHYGRVGQLNTVEALCAASYLLGRPASAAGLLAGFRGGDQFLTINRARLDRFADGTGPDEVRLIERELFGGVD